MTNEEIIEEIAKILNWGDGRKRMQYETIHG